MDYRTLSKEQQTSQRILPVRAGEGKQGGRGVGNGLYICNGYADKESSYYVFNYSM